MIKEDVVRLEKKRDTIARECLTFETRKEAELSFAKNHNMPAKVIKQLEDDLRSAKASTLSSLSVIDADLKAARLVEANEAETARALLIANSERMKEGTKDQMFDAWIREGGNPEDFEANWSQLYGAGIMERTKKRIAEIKNNSDKEVRRMFAGVK